MSALKIIQAFAKKSLTKDQGSGITTLPSQFMAESKAGEIAALLQQAGMPLQQLDNFIRSEKDLLKFLNIIENANKPRVIPATSVEGKAITEKLLGKKGEVVSFKDTIESMKKSGDIVGPDNLKKNDNVLTREMFKNSNLNKEPISEKFIDYTIQDINKKEPLEGMKIANKIIKREGEFKDLTEAQSQRILKETDDHLTGRDLDYDPEDFYAKGGRAGHYTGGIVDVEPSLDDIGHGSDALMARTRLVSPGNQATTSTGLNYLLAEDNDNMRVPFAKGKLALADAARRKFMKAAGATGAGIAALKTGLLGFADKAAPVVEKTAEAVSNTAGQVPPYFFKLVEKIKTLGDETLASQDKAIAKKYKDYVMEEDFAGNITIIKKGDDNLMTRDGDVYMSYKVDEVPVKGKKGSTKVEEYEEFTARPDAEGKMKDIEPGVPDEVVQEGTMFEDNMTEFGKADGGRIGLFLGGGLTYGKGLLKNMLKFMSKDGSHKKSPAEILKMMNPKQYEKLLNNPKYQGQVSSEAPEGLDKIIQDMIGKTKTDRSDMVGDIISTSRKIKKTDDDIIDYKNKIIKDLMDRGSDRETAEQFAETLALQVSKAAGKKSTPEITEQGLLELENIQKNLVTKDRKLQATGGLTTMLGE